MEALYIADTATGLHNILTTNVFQPHAVWSPGGTSIAYRSFDPRGISTIDSDGTNEDLVLWGNAVTRILNPIWSPTGSHLVYSRDNVFLGGDRDVYRATAEGKQRSNLTPDIDPWSIPFAWRDYNNGGTPTPPAAPSSRAFFQACIWPGWTSHRAASCASSALLTCPTPSSQCCEYFKSRTLTYLLVRIYGSTSSILNSLGRQVTTGLSTG